MKMTTISRRERIRQSHKENLRILICRYFGIHYGEFRVSGITRKGKKIHQPYTKKTCHYCHAIY